MTGRRKRRTRREPDLDILGEFIRTMFGNLPPIPPEVVQISPIPVDLYRKLVMLCHPDKHGNSETSTEVTRWLIENDPRKKR